MKKNIAQKFLISAVKSYQKTLSPDHSFWAKNNPPYCKFFPTCSDYMIESIEKNGAIIGFGKGILRICRCNPWSKWGLDLVEDNHKNLQEKSLKEKILKEKPQSK